MKDNRRTVKAFANAYYDQLKKGIIPRSEIKRDFYDQGKKRFKENTLDAVWTAFMEETYNPSSQTLGASKHKTKEKTKIMEQKNKRGPKPRKIQFMDSKFEAALKIFHSVEEVAKNFDMKVSAVRKVLALKDEDKIGKDFKHRLRYEPKNTNSKEVPYEMRTPIIEMPVPKPKDKENFFGSQEFKEILRNGEETAEKIIPYRQQLLNKLDDARTEYIEALKSYAIGVISQYGIDLEEKDIHLVAYLDEEFK